MTPRRRVRALAVVVCSCLAWLLGGCSREGPADEPGREAEATSAEAAAETAADGCALLTAEEIQAATGLSPVASEAAGVGDMDCDWSASDGRTLVGVVVSRTQDTYEEYIQNVRQTAPEMVAESEAGRVDGVGDYAIWYQAGYLNAVRDGRLLVVWTYAEPTNGKSKREAAIELARSGLPRL